MRVEATILVDPTPKARPRFGITSTGRRYAYTPKKTVHAETLIREALAYKGCFEQGVPVKLKATFYRQRPKSLPKRIKLPVTKPDLSNFLKTLEDSLNKFAYSADGQITSISVKKRYGVPPRIELVLESDNED